ISEWRVGHRGPHGRFENPEIPIAHGTEIIKGRSLVNDRAICPSAAFPATESEERVPDSGQIRTFRVSLNLLADGFVEATADQTFVNLAIEQCNKGHHKISGQALYVPIIEAPGQTAVGPFDTLTSPIFATRLGNPMTSLGPTASPTSIISPASSVPLRLPHATRYLLRPPRPGKAPSCSQKWAASSVTSRR